MKAGRLQVSTRTFAIRDVPVPTPGTNQVLVKVMAAGVCLSDVHFLEGSLSPGSLVGDEVTLGHEVAGVIESIGSAVTKFQTGERVLVVAGERDQHNRLRTMGFDYDGGYAEYVVVSENLLVPIPDSLSFEQACIIPDAVSTPWAAVTSTANIQSGQFAVVLGVGGLGFHAVQLLKILGVHVIAIDPLEAARERALSIGAEHAFHPEDPQLKDALREITQSRGVSAVFDFAGVASMRTPSLAMLGEGGKLVIVGLANQPITIPSDMVFAYKRTQILGHYGSEKIHTEQLVNLATEGKLDLSASISATLPLSKASEALDQLSKKIGNPIRIVLLPHAD